MSISISFYTFAKKENSTARPSTPVVTFDCELISGCSILNPRIIIQGATATYNPFRLNYAHIQEFDRYYYVSDWTWDSGLWYASCAVDALASWRIGIGTNSQYITRCSTISNPKITDSLYPATNVIYTRRTFANPDESVSEGNPVTFNGGFYVMSVINNSNDDVTEKNIVTYYAMTPSQFAVVSKALFTGDFWDRVASGALKFNDYVLGLQWFPYLSTVISGLELRPTVVIGNWPLLNAPAYLIKRTNVNIPFTFKFYDIPKHPQYSSFGYYMNCEPWSRYELYWPPIGKIPLDGRAIAKGLQVVLRITVDLRTGAGDYTINCGEDFIGDGNGKFSVPLPIASLAVDFEAICNALSNLAGIASSAVNGDFGGVVDNLTGFVGNAIDATTPVPHSSGTFGSASAFTSVPVIYSRHFESVAHDPDRGAPYCAVRKINELSGAFIMIPDPHFELNCTSEELTIISNYARGGFYYE